MATNTPENPHFDISAAVVKQLGEELVTDEVTAIMELVKNAYDACSNWVKIDIDTKGTLSGEPYKYSGDKGYIIIEDGGFGMTEDEVKKGWLVISLSQKRKMKELGEKTPCGRTPLGDKGLGRLSTQRLGHRLEMFTSKKNEDVVHHVAFDWRDFKEDVPLSKVPTFFKNISKTHQPKGTRLVVRNLKEVSAWEGASADRFKGQLSQLIFPFKEKRTFHVYLTINGEKIDLDELNEALRNQAVSRFQFNFEQNVLTIRGSVKAYKIFGGSPSPEDRDNYQKLINEDKGRKFFNFLTNKSQNKSNFLDGIDYSGKGGILYDFERKYNLGELPNRSYVVDGNNEVLADPGDFFGEIDDFNLREADSLDSVFDDFSQFKNIVKNQKGVRVFRDGFGIKPFGIDGEDWLHLGGSWTSGTSYYGLKPSNTIGFVSLGAEKNKNLKEKTDREGFMDSPYSRNFFLLMDKIVDQINDSLEKTRRSYNDYKRFVAQESGKITDIKESFKRIQNTSDIAKNLQVESHRLTPMLSRVAASVRQTIKKVENTKPKNAEDEHQRKLMSEIDESLQKAVEILIKIDSILEVAKKLEHDANYIKPKVEDLESQLSEFAELAGLGLTAEALSHEISNIVDRLLEQTNNIQKKIKGKETIDTSPVFVYVEYVKSSIQSFRKQLSHLAPSLRYVRESKQEISVNSYFEELASYYKEKFDNEIELDIKFARSDFKIKMSKGKLTQVVDNIFLNSEYWLKDHLKTNKKFNPKIIVEIAEPYVRIYDNGLGIDPSNAQRIFQPFVTTKPKSVGRGLGLFIVQQLLDTVGCELTLLEEKNVHNRRYIFQINFSSIII